MICRIFILDSVYGGFIIKLSDLVWEKLVNTIGGNEIHCRQ